MSHQVSLPPLIGLPSVSVVIPNYNYGAYLPTAVRSALDQPGVGVEVIIVDDCSTDGSVEIARALEARDTRVSLVAHERNMRHIATYNDGLRLARGKYVVLLSADDALAAGALKRATSLMEADPSIGLVYGHPRDFSGEVPPADPLPVAWPGAELTWTKWSGREWVRHMCRRGRNMVRSPEVVMRTELLHELGGGWDSRFPHSADMFLWMRAGAHADVGRVNGRIQAYYRVHGVNMHSTQFGGLLDDFVARRETYDAFFDADGDRLEDAPKLQALARLRLAREALRQVAYLPNSTSSNYEARALFDFAHELAPSDRLVREFYRVVTSHYLRRVWFRFEAHRTYLRDEREVRRGT